MHYGDRDDRSTRRCRRWSAGSTSSGRSATARSSGRRRDWGERGFTFGDWLQPGGADRKAAADHRRRLRGDDLPLHLVDADREGGRASSATRRVASAHERARATTVKQAFADEFITPSGRLVYDDQTSYALAFLHDLIPAEHSMPATGATSRRRSPAPTAASAPASSARRRSCRRWSRSARPTSPRRSSCRRRCPGWLYQVKSGATTIWERWDAIQRRRHDLRPADELLQPLCLWRGLPVAVRERGGLPPRPGRARASSTSSSSRPSSRRCRRCRRATTPRPAASRPAGRVDGDRVDLSTSSCPTAPSGTLVLVAALRRRRRRRRAARIAGGRRTKRAACSRPGATPVTFRISSRPETEQHGTTERRHARPTGRKTNETSHRALARCWSPASAALASPGRAWPQTGDADLLHRRQPDQRRDRRRR